MAITIQMTMVGGKDSPKNRPFIAARFDNHPGTVPNTLPANCDPMEVMICVNPATAKPDPSVTISA